MKQILLLLSLFFAVSVNAQKKIIVTGGGGGTPIDTAGAFVNDVVGLTDTTIRQWKGGVASTINVKGRNYLTGDGLTKSGNTFRLGGSFSNNVILSSIDKSLSVTIGDFSANNSSYYSLSPGTGLETYYNSSGANSSHLKSDVGLELETTGEFGKSTSLDVTVNGFEYTESDDGEDIGFNINLAGGFIFTRNGESYRLPNPIGGGLGGLFIVGDSTTGELGFEPIANYMTGGGGASNFPTVNDTFSTGTPRIYLTGSAKVEIGGAFVNMSIAGDEIKFTSTLVENTITTTDQSFRTGSTTENGRLYITSNYAQISARNAGGVTSNFTAFRNYAQIAAADSLKITGLQEKAIDTLDYQLVIDDNNRVHKVKRQVLKADSTVTVTDSTITVNRAAVLGYREYVASLTQTGTNAPVATVLFNNLGDSVVWGYNNAGQYEALYYNGGAHISISGSKVVVSMTNNVFYSPSYTKSVYIEAIYSNTVNVFTRSMDSADPGDDILGELNTGYGSETSIITIRIYE